MATHEKATSLNSPTAPINSLAAWPSSMPPAGPPMGFASPMPRLRRRTRAPQLSLDGPRPPQWTTSNAPRPEQMVSTRQERERVRQVLETLPTDYRAAVVLRYWYGLSYQEIADAMDTTESAIKSRLHRARRMMAGQLETA